MSDSVCPVPTDMLSEEAQIRPTASIYVSRWLEGRVMGPAFMNPKCSSDEACSTVICDQSGWGKAGSPVLIKSSSEVLVHSGL